MGEHQIMPFCIPPHWPGCWGRMGTCTTTRQWLLLWREHHRKAADSFQKHKHPVPGALNTSELDAKCNPDKSTHRELENDGVFLL